MTTFCTSSDHFKIAHIQEHVLPLHDLTMLNSTVSSVQHQITLRQLTFKNMLHTSLFVVPPKITTHPPKIIFIKEGVNLTLNCTAIGFPLPSVIWLKDNASLPGTHLFPERGKGLRLHFTNITYDRKGKYSCVATNSVGKASFDAKVIFQGKTGLF